MSVYRCDQSDYNESEELQKHIDSKQVRCCEDGCCFRSTLAEFLLHDHGKAAYSNAHVDFSCFRQRLIQPSFTHDNSSSAVLSTSSRSQLLQVITSPAVSSVFDI